MKNDLDKMHDKAFEAAFRNEESIRVFLDMTLPEPLKKNILLSHLEIDKTRYVSDHIKDTYADLVVKTKMKTGDGGPGEEKLLDTDIYILFEHKSTEVDKTPTQILSYMLPIWQLDAAAKRPLRVIIPLVFYHGAKEWSIPRNFAELFNVPAEVKPFLLDYHYLLFDTNLWNFHEQGNEALKEHVLLLTILLLMQAAYRDDMESIKDILRFWHENGFTKDRELTIFVLAYITYIRDVSLDELKKTLEECNIEGGDLMPSLAQRLKEEGYELGERSGVEKGERIGIEKGEQRERRKTVRNMHQNGIPMETIAKVTGLSRDEVEELLRTTH